jgi:hypothetical protein
VRYMGRCIGVQDLARRFLRLQIVAFKCVHVCLNVPVEVFGGQLWMKERMLARISSTVRGLFCCRCEGKCCCITLSSNPNSAAASPSRF